MGGSVFLIAISAQILRARGLRRQQTALTWSYYTDRGLSESFTPVLGHDLSFNSHNNTWQQIFISHIVQLRKSRPREVSQFAPNYQLVCSGVRLNWTGWTVAGYQDQPCNMHSNHWGSCLNTVARSAVSSRDVLLQLLMCCIHYHKDKAVLHSSSTGPLGYTCHHVAV